jgi:hypothetical protein
MVPGVDEMLEAVAGVSETRKKIEGEIEPSIDVVLPLLGFAMKLSSFQNSGR